MDFQIKVGSKCRWLDVPERCLARCSRGEYHWRRTYLAESDCSIYQGKLYNRDWFDHDTIARGETIIIAMGLPDDEREESILSRVRQHQKTFKSNS